MLLSGDRLALPAGLESEWLLTNGLGGYAMGTASGIATRAYHGWLIASEDPPRRRRLRLSKVEIGVTTASSRTALSSNLYSDAVYPDGATHLLSFSTEPCPTWRYRVGTAVAELCLQLVPGRNACLVELAWEGEQVAEVDLRPLVNDRDHHGRTQRGDFTLRARTLANGFLVQGGSGLPMALTFAVLSPGGDPAPLQVLPDPDPVWVERMRYPEEARRGYPEFEDHASPGVVRAWLLPEGRLRFLADVAEGATLHLEPPGWERAAFLARPGGEAGPGSGREALAEPARPEPPSLHLSPGSGTKELRESLRRARSHFLVRNVRKEIHVIAGYPWFEEWARDTFVSVPGLLLSGGETEAAASVLTRWADLYRSEFAVAGFDGEGRPFGLAADAPLHFILAVYRLWAYGARAEPLVPRIGEMLARYVTGFGPGGAVHVDEEGLVFAALPGTALTWMDAKTTVPATPRDGYPVEISALFYKCLRIAERLDVPLPEELSRAVGTDPKAWGRMAEKTRQSFRRRFLRPDGMLYDRLRPDGSPDPTVRPNQLYATGWPFPLLSVQESADLLEALEPPLWTPRGLRTLSPDDPRYRGRYEGTQEIRDLAYHQGTVWPYLIGVWSDVQHYAYPTGSGPKALRNCLEAMRPMVDEGVLGQVAELYSGDPPQRPQGALAQAWSVAEMSRALEEWVYEGAPPVLMDPGRSPGLPDGVETSDSAGPVREPV